MLGRGGNILTRNGYVYVLNNPLKYTDPSGEEEAGIVKPDITDKVISTLIQNGTHMQILYNEDKACDKWYIPGIVYESARLETYLQFANLVRPGGEWDYKRADYREYKDQSLIIAGVEDLQINYEARGNLNYSFAGVAAGIPTETLLSTAGVAQIVVGGSDISWSKSYFDDPKDQKFIKAGIDLYKHYQLNIGERELKKSLEWNFGYRFFLPAGKNYWTN